MIYYACSYVPMEILFSTGEKFKRLKGSDYSHSNLIHCNLCGYSKAIFSEVMSLEEGDIFIGVDSCDAMRRILDVLDERAKAQIFSLKLPWKREHLSEIFLYAEFERLIEFLNYKFKRKIEYKDLEKGIKSYNSLVDYVAEISSKTYGSEQGKLLTKAFNGEKEIIKNDNYLPINNRISVSGGVIDPEEIANIIEQSGGNMINLNTCTGTRAFNKCTESDGKTPVEAIAKRILDREPCGRFFEGDKYNCESDGIIKIQPKFCDFYDSSYNKTGKPQINLQLDYPIDSRGQLKTRIGAFLENIPSKKLRNNSPKNLKDGKKSVFFGIDCGSTTTNIVVLDENEKIVFWKNSRTGANAEKTINELLDRAFVSLNIDENDIKYCISTGYGRDLVKIANEKITEITCHAKGVVHDIENAKSIIDIGGQDSKIITLNEKGKVDRFVMNDKCAAGTGRFLEVMAGVMQKDLDQMAEISKKSNKNLSISSMCTVFAESEVISLIGKGEKLEDISSALFKAISRRIINMYKGLNALSPVVFTGGVARNSGMVAALEKQLNTKIIIPEIPDIMGAYGAALFASEKTK